ncbi:WhiB family transcriptional regulator [Actinomadura viridis]|uniref:WhiB family transcriptional regulator n=1 Tax=Actinomadura viridis TaxID=58110 RepID=UPI00368FC37F
MTDRYSAPALGAQATKHAGEGRTSRPIPDPNEVPVSRHLFPIEALAAVDLRGEPVAGAQCRFDPDLHTGPGDESPEEQAVRESVAAEVCQSCPLRGACLDLAVRILPEYGVWAGFTATELAELADLNLNEVA